MNITKRYVHPQEQTILDAMEKAPEVKGRQILDTTRIWPTKEGRPSRLQLTEGK